jgi:WD40 repeat protein
MRRSLLKDRASVRLSPRRGIALFSLKESALLLLLVAGVLYGLQGVKQSLEPQSAATLCDGPTLALSLDESTQSLWVLRRPTGLGRWSLSDPPENVIMPFPKDLCNFSMSQAKGQTYFASIRTDGMAQLHIDGQLAMEHCVSTNGKITLPTINLAQSGRLVAAITGQGVLHVWRLGPNGYQHSEQTLGLDVDRMEVHRDGRWVAILCPGNDLRLWDLERETWTASWNLQHKFCSGMAWSADGQRLATIGIDHHVRVWETPSGRLLWEREADSLDPYGVSFSPCGRYLATGGFDATARVWDAHSGTQVAEQAQHTRPVRIFAWSSDSRTLYTSGLDGKVLTCAVPAASR